MLCSYIVPKTITMKLPLTPCRICPPDEPNVLKQRKLLVQIASWVDQCDFAIKLRSSKWVSENEHRALPVRPISVRAKLYLLVSFTNDRKVIPKVCVEKITITKD